MRLDDYRELRGEYDKLVSIEMIEAVGWKDFGTFFKRCASLLRPDGVMALQAITIDDRLYEVEKAQRSFMNSLIFPNGCLPSIEVIARNVARRSDLRMVDLEDITPHYAETLRRWRGNVDAGEERLRGMGYDDRFLRLWRLYLSFCEAGFTERRIGCVQLVLGKPRWRGHLATAEAAAPVSAVDRAERVRRAAIGVFGLHIAYGAVLLVVPYRITRSWLGPAVASDPVKVPLRGIAGREIVWHGLGIAAALRGDSLRPWLVGSLLGDLGDVVATVVDRSGLPDDAPRKTALAAGGSAALTAAVLALS